MDDLQYYVLKIQRKGQQGFWYPQGPANLWLLSCGSPLSETEFLQKHKMAAHTDLELGHLGQKIVKLSGVYFLKVQPYTFQKRYKIKYFYYIRLKYEQKHIFQY